jgi:rhodanese-related sulfurtransferase
MDFIVVYAANHPMLFGGLLLMFAIVFTYEMRVARRKGVDLTPSQAVALLNNGALPVDVRPAAQYEKGHIVEARNIPMSDLEQHFPSLEKLNDRGLLVYCDNGAISLKAVEQLRARGVASAMGLRGGLAAWRAENLPLVSGRKARGK